jgi:hypothetical protein
MKDTVSQYIPLPNPLTSTAPQASSNNLTMPAGVLYRFQAVSGRGPGLGASNQIVELQQDARPLAYWPPGPLVLHGAPSSRSHIVGRAMRDVPKRLSGHRMLIVLTRSLFAD